MPMMVVLIPEMKKKITFKYKPYTAYKIILMLSTLKITTSLKQKEKQQFISKRNLIKKLIQELSSKEKETGIYRICNLNPSISTQIGRRLPKTIALVQQTLLGSWGCVSAIAPNQLH